MLQNTSTNPLMPLQAQVGVSTSLPDTREDFTMSSDESSHQTIGKGKGRANTATTDDEHDQELIVTDKKTLEDIMRKLWNSQGNRDPHQGSPRKSRKSCTHEISELTPIRTEWDRDPSNLPPATKHRCPEVNARNVRTSVDSFDESYTLSACHPEVHRGIKTPRPRNSTFH